MGDLLRVKGLGKADGTYPFDLVELLRVDGNEGLTSREQHQIRLVAGVRGAEIPDAIFSADAAVMVALAGILLRRSNHSVSDDVLWDVRMVYSSNAGEEPPLDGYERVLNFHLDTREPVEDEPSPPAEAPPA